MVGSIKVLLHISTKYLKRRPKTFLMMELTPTSTVLRFWALVTHSVPTFDIEKQMKIHIVTFGLIMTGFKISPSLAQNLNISIATLILGLQKRS